MAQIRHEGASIQSSDPPLSTGNTVGSGEDRMEHVIELTDLVPQRPYDSRLLGDEEVIVKDKGSGEKGGSTAKVVSTAIPDISAARTKVSTSEPKIHPTTTLIDDEDVTIADTLTKKRDQDQIERDAEVALKIQADLDEEVGTERER
nr:hypothetical protein [Tanacetum cinerariifolium]